MKPVALIFSLSFVLLIHPLARVEATQLSGPDRAGPEASEPAVESHVRCNIELEKLDRLFSDGDDDFPSEVDRLGLFDFLTAQRHVLFSNYHFQAIEKTFKTNKFSATYIKKHFKKLTPAEKIVFGTSIWQNMVETANELNSNFQASQKSSQDLSSVQNDLAARVRAEEAYNAGKVFIDSVFAVDADPLLKAATIELIGASLQKTLDVAGNANRATQAIEHWKLNKAGLWGPSESTKEAGFMGISSWGSMSRKSQLNGWASLAGFITAVSAIQSTHSFGAGLGAFAARRLVVPAVYSTVEFSRAAYHKTAGAIRKRRALKQIKGEIQTESK